MRAGRIAVRFKIVELQVMWLGGGRGCGETVFLQKLTDKLGREDKECAGLLWGDLCSMCRFTHLADILCAFEPPGLGAGEG